MPVLHCTFQGRFGNQVMQYLFARAFAVKWRYEFTSDPWIGERIFEIEHTRYTGPELPRFNEITLGSEKGDCEFRGYAQMQPCMIYTRRQAREMLRFRPEIEQVLRRIIANRTPITRDSIVAHQRVGDYPGYGYPVISRQSYRDAAVHYFGSCAHLAFVAEEQPVALEPLPDELSFLPDFYRMTQAPTLMRANSSFSFVAGLLSSGLVLSPRIDGLAGGVEHDGVKFEAGNHCRLSHHDFCSDLYMS